MEFQRKIERVLALPFFGRVDVAILPRFRLQRHRLQWFHVAYSLLYVLPKLHRPAQRYKACTARGDRESGFSRNGRFLYNPASERRLMIYYMGEELRQDERVSGEVLLA